MRRIIQIDGGGVKGFIPLMSLYALEKKIGFPLYSKTDAFIGTSVGAILAALFAVGSLSAGDIIEIMSRVCPKIFTRRRSIFPPRYSRDAFLSAWNNCGLSGVRMGDVRTLLVLTAVDVCDGRTHFFKSDADHDKGLLLSNVVCRSFAAPYYFGGMTDRSTQSVWIDGGTGIDNCPLPQALTEALRRSWSPVHILSLGCGYHHPRISYRRAASRLGKTLREIGVYLSRDDGGLARRQSIESRVAFAHTAAEAIPDFSLQRIDTEIPEKLDKMDVVSEIPSYIEIGKGLSKQIDHTPFLS